MKRYLIKVGLFILPMVLLLTPIEIFLRENPYKAKRNHLKEHKDSIEVLILGPSYSFRAMNPEFFDIPTASLAHVGSAVNTNLMLFDKYASELPNLKYVFFDLSLGFLERNNGDGWEGNHLLNIYYGVQNQTNTIKNHFLLTANFQFYIKLMASYLYDNDNMELFNNYGFIYKLSKRNDLFREYGYDVEKLQKSGELFKGLDFQNEVNEENYKMNTELLHSFIQKCTSRDIEIIFISPPKFYLNNEKTLPLMSERRQKFLEGYKDKKNIHFWNYETYLEKKTELFYDETHLNPEGAKQFSTFINDKLVSLYRQKQQAKLK